ncbi:MAG: thiamine phosphate synthase [Dehalococcoidia bacterium]
MKSLADSRLHLITDRSLCGDKPLQETVSAAVEGGVDAVHLREKDLATSDLYAMALQLRDTTKGRALLIINDRMDIALAVDADGVQLGHDALPLPVARGLAGEGMLLGRSVHSLEEALEAQRLGSDYLLVGTIYPSRSHPQLKVSGLDLLRRVRTSVDLPIYAIGGINAENAPEAIRAGANGVAVISAILGAADVKEATVKLLRALEGALKG